MITDTKLYNKITRELLLDLEPEDVLTVLIENNAVISNLGEEQRKQLLIKLTESKATKIKSKQKLTRHHDKLKSDPVYYKALNLYNSCKKRAQEKGLAFDLTIEWMMGKLKEGKCEVTGFEFEITPFIDKSSVQLDYLKLSYTSPSVDKIDASKGYTKDNCRLVLLAYNHLKSDKNFDMRLYKLCKKLCKIVETKGLAVL